MSLLDVDQSISLVPPGRFGALLAERRRDHGYDLATLAARSNGAFDVLDLELLEKGRTLLNDSMIARAALLYELDAGPVVPSRTRLVIDIDAGLIDAGESITEIPRATSGEVLERYLALVYGMRNEMPGKVISLRDDDIDVLTEALGLTRQTIEEQLRALMRSQKVERKNKSLLRRISVPGVGLLIGFTSIGALILAPSAGAQVNDAAADLGQTAPVALRDSSQAGVELSAEAVSITRDASGVAESSVQISETATTVTRAEQLGTQAEALISYDWQSQLPSWTVSYEDERPGYRGMTNRPEKTVTVYVRATDSPHDVAEVLAHELAHALDLQHLNDAHRLAWLEVRGLPHVWWAEDGVGDFEVGQGDFAEAVAVLWVGGSGHAGHGDFSPDELKLAQELLP